MAKHLWEFRIYGSLSVGYRESQIQPSHYIILFIYFLFVFVCSGYLWYCMMFRKIERFLEDRKIFNIMEIIKTDCNYIH